MLQKYNMLEGGDAGQILLILVIIIVVFLILGWIVMFTWNYTLPNITSGVGPINIYQAIALLVLVAVLFGGHGSWCMGAMRNMSYQT